MMNTSLEQKVMDRIKSAMKAKDEAALRTLRAIKSAIQLEKTASGGGAALTAEGEIRILQKMVKQRKDSLDIYEAQGRADLATKEKEEIDILHQFLPEPLSPLELEMAIRKLMEESGLDSAADMGKLIGMANKTLQGRAEGKNIAETVKRLLSSSSRP